MAMSALWYHLIFWLRVVFDLSLWMTLCVFVAAVVILVPLTVIYYEDMLEGYRMQLELDARANMAWDFEYPRCALAAKAA